MAQINLDKIRKIHEKLEARRTSSSYSEHVYLKPKEKNNIFRVLPPSKGKDIPFKELGWHYLANSKTYLCPAVLENDPCPICEMAEKLDKSSLKNDKDIAKDLQVQVNAAVNVIDREDDEVKIWITSPKIYREIVELIAEWESLYPDSPDFTDPKNGRDFNLKKETTKRGKRNIIKYTLNVLDKKPLVTDKTRMKEILNNIVDLDTVFTSMGHDKLKELFSDYEDDIESFEQGEDKEEKSNKEPEEKKEKKDRKPKCFGEDFDKEDDDCMACDCMKECRKLTKSEDDEKEIEKEETDDDKEKDTTSGEGTSVDEILKTVRKNKRSK